jgi:hypothetical protein
MQAMSSPEAARACVMDVICVMLVSYLCRPAAGCEVHIYHSKVWPGDKVLRKMLTTGDTAGCGGIQQQLSLIFKLSDGQPCNAFVSHASKPCGCWLPLFVEDFAWLHTPVSWDVFVLCLCYICVTCSLATPTRSGDTTVAM